MLTTDLFDTKDWVLDSAASLEVVVAVVVVVVEQTVCFELLSYSSVFSSVSLFSGWKFKFVGDLRSDHSNS